MKLLIEQIDDFLLEARIDDHIAQLPSGMKMNYINIDFQLIS